MQVFQNDSDLYKIYVEPVTNQHISGIHENLESNPIKQNRDWSEHYSKLSLCSMSYGLMPASAPSYVRPYP